MEHGLAKRSAIRAQPTNDTDAVPEHKTRFYFVHILLEFCALHAPVAASRPPSENHSPRLSSINFEWTIFFLSLLPLLAFEPSIALILWMCRFQRWIEMFDSIICIHNAFMRAQHLDLELKIRFFCRSFSDYFFLIPNEKFFVGIMSAGETGREKS